MSTPERTFEIVSFKAKPSANPVSPNPATSADTLIPKVPANRKWFRNLAVASVIVECLESLDMRFPEPSFDVSEIRID